MGGIQPKLSLAEEVALPSKPACCQRPESGFPAPLMGLVKPGVQQLMATRGPEQPQAPIPADSSPGQSNEMMAMLILLALLSSIFKKNIKWHLSGTVSQSVKCLTLGFSLGGDLKVVRWSFTSGSRLSAETA